MSPSREPVAVDEISRQLQGGFTSVVFCAVSIPTELVLRLTFRAVMRNDLGSDILSVLQTSWLWQGHMFLSSFFCMPGSNLLAMCFLLLDV